MVGKKQDGHGGKKKNYTVVISLCVGRSMLNNI